MNKAPRIVPKDRWRPERRARRQGAVARMGTTARRVPLALLVSLGLHLGLVVGALLFLRSAGRVPDRPDQETTVELVMVEHKGEAKPPAPARPAPPPVPMPRASEEPRTAPVREQRPPEAKAEPAPMTPPVRPPVETPENAPEETKIPPELPEPAPEPEPARTKPAPVEKAEAKPEAAAPPPAPRISLSGTDSPSDAVAEGGRIMPAAADAVFHNRPPEYPDEAARRGEHGVVVVVIHISPQGQAEAVDVVSSSGYALLDRATREAVLTWRFLPAVKGGRAVRSDMPMRFVFDGP